MRLVVAKSSDELSPCPAAVDAPVCLLYVVEHLVSVSVDRALVYIELRSEGTHYATAPSRLRHRALYEVEPALALLLCRPLRYCPACASSDGHQSSAPGPGSCPASLAQAVHRLRITSQ